MGSPTEFKIVLSGDAGVGKTSLLQSFIDGKLETNITYGTDYRTKEININGKQVKLKICDTAGMDRFRSPAPNQYRQAQGIVVVYAVTDRETFNGANFWITKVDENCDKECVKILVGNQIDRESARVVTTDEGKALAERHGYMFLETSAVTSKNVAECFQDLGQKIIEKLNKETQEEENKNQPEQKAPEPPKNKNQPAQKAPEPPKVEIKPAPKPSSYTAPPKSKCC